jgi:hypothetical protein
LPRSPKASATTVIARTATGPAGNSSTSSGPALPPAPRPAATPRPSTTRSTTRSPGPPEKRTNVTFRHRAPDTTMRSMRPAGNLSNRSLASCAGRCPAAESTRPGPPDTTSDQASATLLDGSAALIFMKTIFFREGFMHLYTMNNLRQEKVFAIMKDTAGDPARSIPFAAQRWTDTRERASIRTNLRLELPLKAFRSYPERKAGRHGAGTPQRP